MAEYAFPTDFIQVYRNGMYLIAVNNGDPVGRLRQTSLDKAIEFASQFPLRTGQPGRFVVTGNGIFQVFPTPDKSYNAEIWYYALPAPLGQRRHRWLGPRRRRHRRRGGVTRPRLTGEGTHLRLPRGQHASGW